MPLSPHVSLTLSLLMSVSLSLHVCLRLFSFLSLSLLFALSFFSFKTLLFFSLALSLSLHPLSFLNSLTIFTHSIRSLSVRKSLTCPESPSARALAHSSVGEVLASCRRNLYRCSVVCGCGCCAATLQRDSWLLPFTRACFETLATLTFGALCETIEKNTKKTMKPRRPRVVSNVP